MYLDDYKIDRTQYAIEQFRKDIEEEGLGKAFEYFIERLVSLELDNQDLQCQVDSLEDRIQTLEEG